MRPYCLQTSIQVSCLRRCRSELKPIKTADYCRSCDPGMNADCTLSNWRQKPDVSGFIVQGERSSGERSRSEYWTPTVRGSGGSGRLWGAFCWYMSTSHLQLIRFKADQTLVPRYDNDSDELQPGSSFSSVWQEDILVLHLFYRTAQRLKTACLVGLKV